MLYLLGRCCRFILLRSYRYQRRKNKIEHVQGSAHDKPWKSREEEEEIFVVKEKKKGLLQETSLRL